MSFTSANMAYDIKMSLITHFQLKQALQIKKVNIQPWSNEDFISSSLQKKEAF